MSTSPSTYVAIDQILPEDCPHLLSTRQIAKILNKHVSTVWRWINTGVLVDGHRVRLRAVRLGGQSVVTAPALRQYLADLNKREHDDQVEIRFDSINRRCEERGL